MSREKWDALKAGFGDRLRQIQVLLGLSQVELAARLGVSDRSIRSYFTMAHPMPSDVIYELLKLGGDLGFLFAGTEGAGVAPVVAAPAGERDVDTDALKRAVAWVDGEWAENGDGTRMDEMERLTWIIQAYQELASSSKGSMASASSKGGKRAA